MGVLSNEDDKYILEKMPDWTQVRPFSSQYRDSLGLPRLELLIGVKSCYLLVRLSLYSTSCTELVFAAGLSADVAAPLVHDGGGGVHCLALCC